MEEWGRRAVAGARGHRGVSGAGRVCVAALQDTVSFRLAQGVLQPHPAPRKVPRIELISVEATSCIW